MALGRPESFWKPFGSCARMQFTKTKKPNDKNRWAFKDSTLI